ncbi:hypothetical protein [Streptomyces sp. NBC_01314]|uniref:hypothetical protein n=1 Tax=Streptomyces sp. NBC_01314 TaxID=2903821 RepID=UPI00308BB80E|nr:hypothetical protein OG622_13985 [Streptomyces sp. NBC_01314]
MTSIRSSVRSSRICWRDASWAACCGPWSDRAGGDRLRRPVPARVPACGRRTVSAATGHPDQGEPTEGGTRILGTTYRLGVLEGDGIGVGIVPSAVQVGTAAARAAELIRLDDQRLTARCDAAR